MSDGSLSQDEIDALLQGTDTIDFGSDFENLSSGGGDGLPEQERTALQSALAGVTASQSSNISMLAGQSIKIGHPDVNVKTRGELLTDLAQDVVEIKTDFKEGVDGEHLTVIDGSTALKIASLMLGQDGIDLNEMVISTVGEAISNIISPAVTAIGNSINATITITPPAVQDVPKTGLSLPPGDSFPVVEYPLTVGGQKTGMTDIYSIELAHSIGSALVGGAGGKMDVPGNSDMPFGDDSDSMFPSNAFGGGNQGGGLGADMGQPFENLMGGTNQPNVQSVQFPNLQSGGSHIEQGNIGLLMDVYMEMTVELGRTKNLSRIFLVSEKEPLSNWTNSRVNQLIYS